ncbi:MAG: hypothetical protein KAG56_01490 [Sulfurovaceae bacterium]|nr:hypothetical protein [Sulfurovaceae bacterium]
MNTHLEELVALSTLDKSIDDFNPLIEAAEKKLARKVTKKDEASEKIERINAQTEDAKSKIASYEEQIKVQNEQMSQGVTKMDAVKNEKELQALQIEEELAKERIKFANEEIERQNEILEVREKELIEADEVFEKINKEVDKVSMEVNEKLTSIESDKGKLFTERESKIIELDQKILAFYEKIRVWARNTAVVPVKKQACFGCYMKLNDSAYAELIKSEDIKTCPNCGRILHLELQKEESEAS